MDTPYGVRLGKLKKPAEKQAEIEQRSLASLIRIALAKYLDEKKEATA